MSGPRWRMPGEVYAYRTRKPGALLGLPLLGRHWTYVGQTRNPRARHGEHMTGVGRYGHKDPQPWTDLAPKRYVLFRMKHCPQWLLDLVEILAIRLLFPAYNVKHNRGNPRRIRPALARAQRAARERAGVSWSPHFTPAHLLLALAVAAVVVMVTQGVV